MSRIITLEIPEETYEAIEMQAETKGLEPAQMVMEWLSEAIRQAQMAAEDPLEALIGTLECEVTDVAEHHNDYIASPDKGATRWMRSSGGRDCSQLRCIRAAGWHRDSGRAEALRWSTDPAPGHTGRRGVD